MTQSATKKALVNFKLAKNLKRDFDKICRMNSETKTNVLTKFIQNYVRQETETLAYRAKVLGSYENNSDVVRNQVSPSDYHLNPSTGIWERVGPL